MTWKWGKVKAKHLWPALGIALLVTGIALLFASIKGLRGGEAATPPGPSPTSVLVYISTVTPTQSSPTPVPTPVNSSPPARLLIPSIDVDGPVITLGLSPDGIPQVPDRTNAQRPGWVVAWYDFSAVPGSGGNAVFSGHVTWDRAPAIFWSLGTLSLGDTIKVVTRDGKELIYKVINNFLVDANDPEAVKVMSPTKEDIITIITCGGTFLPNPSDPYGGSYTHRVVVRAALERVNPTASAHQ